MVEQNEIFAFLRPANDAHSLGITSIGSLIEKCGYKVIYADAKIANALETIFSLDSSSYIVNWISENNISQLGFSYRLDPHDGQYFFGKLYNLLKSHQCFVNQGGRLKNLYFAGLPETCKIIQSEYNNEIRVFYGDESSIESLRKLEIPSNKIPQSIISNSKYDDNRFRFAKSLIEKADYTYQMPLERLNYPNYGSRKDSLVERLYNHKLRSDLPLTRVHVGPYNPDYKEAKKEFLSWLKTLSDTKYLDIVSVGSSQLSQSNFGEEWGDKPNGGGVPINSEIDLYDIYEASRPMLVRTYAGTKNIAQLASIYEKTLNISWHALSFWWFNQIDGRGGYSVLENLKQHFDTLKYISQTNKPFEPNVPHHFAFRGADDFTYVLSGFLAAKAAKLSGIKHLVLQIMLNTPKYTLGIQDLAKARALVALVRSLEDKNFKVFLQPRAGLDYFSPDLDKAKIQLASVSAMMDDIEPNLNKSPDIIHVVSYCEAVHLATPSYINESIQISLQAIKDYRQEKQNAHMDNLQDNLELKERSFKLYNNVIQAVDILEKNVKNLYSPQGFYDILQQGVFAIPYLWEGREEFAKAVNIKTDFIDGGVSAVDSNGKPIDNLKRIKEIYGV